jgi:hypothetical protein
MTEPLIYISTWKVKEGRLEDYKQFATRLLEIFEAREPQLIAMNIFINEEGTEMTSIQFHPDASSMDFHLRILDQALGEDMAEWVARADFLEPRHAEIYGAPSAALLEADQPLVDAGALPRKIKPIRIAGFTRTPAG